MHFLTAATFGLLSSEFFRLDGVQYDFLQYTLVRSDCPGFPKGVWMRVRIKKPASG